MRSIESALVRMDLYGHAVAAATKMDPGRFNYCCDNMPFGDHDRCHTNIHALMSAYVSEVPVSGGCRAHLQTPTSFR